MDLIDACAFAEEMCNELVSISSAMENPGTILQATDKKGAPFLDVLIECELKQVFFWKKDLVFHFNVVKAMWLYCRIFLLLTFPLIFK